MKTYQPKAGEIKRNWHLFDAKDQILGRLATKISHFLMGKQKVIYVPHLDCGDYVVVVNASQIQVTGKKMKKKIYFRHTGYMGNLKEARLEELMAKDPKKVIWLAVENMLPKNKLRKRRLKRLKISLNSEHAFEDKFKSKKNARKKEDQ